MKLLRKVLGFLGYVPAGAMQAAMTGALRAFQRQRRGYDAGAQSRLTLDFSGASLSADSDLVRHLRVMRGRSRHLVKNEPYARRYARLVEKNIAGPAGVQLSILGRGDDASSELRLSKEEADAIERRWIQWCSSAWCTTGGRMSWPQAQRLALRNGCTDGEVFCRLVRDQANPFLLSLEWFVPEQIDEQLNSGMQGGGEMRMGVEFDSQGRRVAYHPYRQNPDDFLGGARRVGRGERLRVPVEEMVHWYLEDFIGQTRGVPWLFSAITRINMLGGYEEAELVASRVAASKMGFIVPPVGTEYAGDGQDEQGNTIVEAQPGTFEALPAGSELKQYDPQHPNANFSAFAKGMLRGVAASGDVSYHTLTGDLEAVNYSSARIGLLDERDGYAVLQDEFIQGFCQPIFRAWLVAQAYLQAVPLSIDEARAFDQILWRPRRWAWVDPQKEITAATQAVALRVRSRTQIVAEQGGSIAQTIQELAAEEQALDAAGLVPEPPAAGAAPGASAGAAAADDSGDGNAGDGEGAQAPSRSGNGHLKPERFSGG